MVEASCEPPAPAGRGDPHRSRTPMESSGVFGGNKRRPSSVEQTVEPSLPAPSAFEQFVLPHLDGAYNLARWLLRNDHDAEDAVQEACVRAHRALPRFRRSDGRGW